MTEKAQINFNDTGSLVFARRSDGRVEMYDKDVFHAYRAGAEQHQGAAFVQDGSLDFSSYMKTNPPVSETEAEDRRIKFLVSNGMLDCW